MTTLPRDSFRRAVKEILTPGLRDLGFKVSGSNYVRMSGEAINAVNIQGSKYGDGCFINLGLHYTFLPSVLGTMPPATGLKEIECEFRWRLTTVRGRDQMWQYDETDEGNRQSAEAILAAFHKHAETVFREFESPNALVKAVGPQHLVNNCVSHLPWDIANVRLALAVARTHLHIGNTSEAKRFAEIGLSVQGRASLLETALREIANAT